MNREQKAATIDVLASELEAADAVFAVDYRGLSVAHAAELRSKLRESEATFRVVKNSLTERAADQAGVEGLKELLQGPTALTLVHGDPALAAKTLAEVARAIQLLPFKGGVMGAETLDPSQLTALSRLPAREVLYGQLVGVVASPIGGLVRSMNALISGLAIALGQVREQRASEAPEESPPPAEGSGGDGGGDAATAEEGDADAAASGDADAEAGSAESAEGAEEPAAEATTEPANAEAAATDEAPGEEAKAEASEQDAAADSPTDSAGAEEQDGGEASGEAGAESGDDNQAEAP